MRYKIRMILKDSNVGYTTVWANTPEQAMVKAEKDADQEIKLIGIAHMEIFNQQKKENQ